MFAFELETPAPLDQRPMNWRETVTPSPSPGQLLMKVAGCGVCRSNLHMIQGDWVPDAPSISPIIPGHEVTGTVVEVGDGVTDFVVGDRVGVMPLWQTCETCEFCTSDREQLCHSRVITGEDVNGGYGEYMISNAAHSYRVPDALDLVAAAPLFCPGITAYGAVSKLNIARGSKVAVFGLGGVGHMALQFAKLTGAEVIAVARSADHLKVAEELGADRLINATEVDPGVELEDLVDAAITFAPSNQVTEWALRSLKRGGTLVAGVGVKLAGFPFNKEQVIHASLLGNRKQMNEVLKLAAEGKVTTVVDLYDLTDAEQALSDLAAGSLRSRAVLENRL